MRKVNLNADIGEGWGAYNIGNDEELMKVIRSANVACGLHAGDPRTMLKLVTLAKQEGVSVGVHPGFNDLWGFGRRQIHMSPRDLEYLVAYQIGALKGMARYADMPVTHLKPHGALNNMAAENEDYAMAIGRAIKTVDDSIIYVALANSAMQRAAEKLGLRLAREAFVDRMYDDDGNLTSRTRDDAMIRDPEKAAEHVLRMVQEGVILSRNGKRVPVQADTWCVHGDEATCVTVARAARKALEDAGIQIVPLTEMDL